MKKIYALLLLSASILGFSQAKGSGVITLQPNMTAEFTLNNATSTVTLILTGPSDRWFAIGIGVQTNFGMAAGDALVYTTTTSPAFQDRGFIGYALNPQFDASQDWALVSDEVSGSVRTLNLTRNLVNSDGTTGQDFQMPYSTTNSFSVVGVRPGTATFNVAGHGGVSPGGYGVANFTTLGTEDFSLNASSIYPNPTKGTFVVSTKTGLNEINVYSQTGAFIKAIKVNKTEASEVSVEGLQTGIYLLELKNDTDKSWKKIVIQ